MTQLVATKRYGIDTVKEKDQTQRSPMETRHEFPGVLSQQNIRDSISFSSCGVASINHCQPETLTCVGPKFLLEVSQNGLKHTGS